MSEIENDTPETAAPPAPRAALDFDDFTLQEEPVKLFGKNYVLREATGAAACKWRNDIFKSTKLGPDGKPVSVDGLADSEPNLVSLCLFERYDDGRGQTRERNVPLATIRGWPQRVVKRLFERAKDMSELGMEDQERGGGGPAKNGRSATTDGSE